jgi:hypothetical protein
MVVGISFTLGPSLSGPTIFQFSLAAKTVLRLTGEEGLCLGFWIKSADIDNFGGDSGPREPEWAVPGNMRLCSVVRAAVGDGRSTAVPYNHRS